MAKLKEITTIPSDRQILDEKKQKAKELDAKDVL